MKYQLVICDSVCLLRRNVANHMMHSCPLLNSLKSLQDVLGPSSAVDPLLESLEQALMEDPLSSTLNKQFTQDCVDGQQHMGEDVYTAALGCNPVA